MLNYLHENTFSNISQCIVLGRVVAVDWVVPKTQYEEAKLTSVEDSGIDDHDEVQNSDEQQSITEQSNEEGQASDDDVVSGDDVTACSDEVNSEETPSEQSKDEGENDDESEDNNETEENFAEKVKIPHHKKKSTNDVTEGRTVFIRYTHACSSYICYRYP